MALEDDIIKLLKAGGYHINETIRDALDEFLEILEDEAEFMDQRDDDIDDEDTEPERED